MKRAAERLDGSPLLQWACFLALSLVFLLFASPYTTPLNRYYGYDSAVFMAFGKGISHGLLPYLDLYDNKGPMIFYINALGWLLGGRTGVFALQAVFMGFALWLVYRLARLFTGTGGAWLSLALFAFYYCGTVGEGNMTEEWSLCFTLLPMFLALRFLLSGRPAREHPAWMSLAYGACLGIQILFRLTNAVPVGGLLLAFAVLLLRERDGRALWKNVGLVLLGALAVTAPFAVYFRRIGAWDDFIYASFLHNFHYAAGGVEGKTAADWLYWLCRISLVPAGLAAATLLYRKGKLDGRVLLALFCTGIPGAMAVSLGFTYKHYFLILAPVLLAVFAALLGAAEKSSLRRRGALIAALFVFAAAPYARQSAVHAGKSILFNFTGYMDENVRAMEEIDARITDRRDSVLAYDLRASVYLYLDVDPCFRHCMTQTWMSNDSPFIADELEELFRDDPPVWIVTGPSQEIAAMLEGYGYARELAVDYGDRPVLYRLARG